MLLIFFLETSNAGAGSWGSLSLGADAAKSYLGLQASASYLFRETDSLSLSYENIRVGDLDDSIRAWGANFGYSLNASRWGASLSGSLGGDDTDRRNGGLSLDVNGSLEYARGFDATLSLSGGWSNTSVSASQSLSPTASAENVSRRARARNSNTVSVTQWSPSATLSLSFFEHLFSTWVSGTRYRYQDFVVGSNLSGSGDRENAAADLKNDLISSFSDWGWTVGASAKLPWKMELSGSYSEYLDLESQSWSKSLSGNLSKDFGEHFSVEGGLSHATENGSGDNTYSAGASYLF